MNDQADTDTITIKMKRPYFLRLDGHEVIIAFWCDDDAQAFKTEIGRNMATSTCWKCKAELPKAGDVCAVCAVCGEHQTPF